LCNTAFPIGHRTTIVPYRVPRKRDQEEIRKVLYGAYGGLKEMMLYVHVPFCHTRCQFCEYTVINPKEGRVSDIQDVYFDALLEEFRLYDELLNTKSKKLIGFDIGGGTPSMARIEQIDRVMQATSKHFDFASNFEISIETTPKIAAAEPDKINAYKKMGINRISMGVQTTDFRDAKKLGRDDANASSDFLYRSVENIRKAGFDSFNIDLMYGFPLSGRHEDTWPQTVKDAIGLEPDHITLYRMRYKGTQMSHLMDRVKLNQVNDQEGTARKLLGEAGYVGSIGKNTYSKTPGSSGCSDYLHRRVNDAVPYLGYGLGAQSFSHHTLQYNLGAVTKAMDQYVRSVNLNRIPVQDLYHLSKEAAIAKMASVSFYFGGIDLASFKNCFKMDLLEGFSDNVKFLLEKKLMVLENGRLQMTTLGKQHFGGVVAQFYSPSVQNYVINLPGGEIFEEDIIHKLDRINKESKAKTEYEFVTSAKSKVAEI